MPRVAVVAVKKNEPPAGHAGRKNRLKKWSKTIPRPLSGRMVKPLLPHPLSPRWTP